jgi:hypothetical protein
MITMGDAFATSGGRLKKDLLNSKFYKMVDAIAVISFKRPQKIDYSHALLINQLLTPYTHILLILKAIPPK